MRGRVAAAVALACTLLGAGCAYADPDPQPERPPADFVQLRPVESTTPPPCTPPAQRLEDVCLVLGPVALDADDIETARRTDNAPTGPALSVGFTAAGDAAFEALAIKQLRRQVAVLVDGRVVAAPTVQEPQSSGGIVLTGIDDPTLVRVARAFRDADS